MNDKNLNLVHLLEVAVSAAASAKVILEKTYSNKDIISSLNKDLKSRADLDSQSAILEFLKKKSKFRIISEEIENAPITPEEICWIVDPLDGTVNFMKGIPFFAVSISLWKGLRPLLGVIYDVPRNQIYTAITDKGAWLNQQIISVSKNSEISQSILATGFPTLFDYSEENIKNSIRDIQLFKKVRMFGSATMSLAYVAEGKIEAYREKSIRLWDIAAGIALVEAAGGHISLKFHDNFLCDVIASNINFEQLRD